MMPGNYTEPTKRLIAKNISPQQGLRKREEIAVIRARGKQEEKLTSREI
jgi:hypothetical protein